MAETLFALTDEDGVVTNVIVADQVFIDALPALIEDPDIETGDLAFDKAYNVTGKGVVVGWKRAANGKFVAPPVREPTPEEIAAREKAEADVAQRSLDDAFLASIQGKLKQQQPLSQAERDRMLLIDLTRR